MNPVTIVTELSLPINMLKTIILIFVKTWGQSYSMAMSLTFSIPFVSAIEERSSDTEDVAELRSRERVTLAMS